MIKEQKVSKKDIKPSRTPIEKSRRRPFQKIETEQTDKPDKQPIEQRFDKAFIISLGIIAILSLLAFIPILGPLLALTLVPYLACNLGCKYVNKMNGAQVGIIVGILWSIVEINLLLQILSFVTISVGKPVIKESIDYLIIFTIFILNIIFCMIGGYTGGAKYEKQLENRTVPIKAKLKAYSGISDRKY
jgi:hypothetical protein